jgi:ABC-type antimicrobial peptide transport system permease subunit
MRAGDLLREAAGALAGSRSRTLLTSAGVTVGSLALILIVSLSLGLSTLVDDFVKGEDQLRQVIVVPGFGRKIDRSQPPEVAGEMSEEKRSRLRRALMKRSRGGPPMQAALHILDPQTERELSEMPEVERTRPFLQERYDLELEGRSADRRALSVGAPHDHPHYPDRLLAGRWFTSDEERAIVVHELLLYEMGLTSDEAQSTVVGKTLRLTARSQAGGMMGRMLGATMGVGNGGGNGGEELYTEELPIVGVVRERFGDEPATIMDEALAMQADLFIPTLTHRELSERRPGQEGLRALVLVARTMDDVEAIEDEARARGLQSRSVRTAVARVKQTLSVATYVAGFLAAIAVFVSCLGIVNTMVMSVLERTREIGLLKALGARSGDVVLLFLVEGALIGLGGGVIGLGLALVLGAVGNRVGDTMIEEAMQMPFSGQMFQFPVWLLLGGVGFAMLTSLLASVVPALRAARIDPVKALRHE